MLHNHNGAARLPGISSVFHIKGREEIQRAKDMLAKTVSYISKVNAFPGALHTDFLLGLISSVGSHCFDSS